MRREAVSFDGQASTFDARAGLPTTATVAVANAVVALAELADGELLVEIGAGSGEIGEHLADRISSSVSYLGFDVAPAMVERFRARTPRAQVVVADAEATWPVADGTARAIFGSRCLHLLSPEHVLGEIDRVGMTTGVTVLVGRVSRDDSSVRMWMRRQMRRLLRDQGIEGRPGGGRIVRDLTERAIARRWAVTPIAARAVASWSTVTSPAEAIAAWGGKAGLAGVAVDNGTKQRVLDRLRSEAIGEFGDLDRRIESTEEYLLAGAHFASRST